MFSIVLNSLKHTQILTNYRLVGYIIDKHGYAAPGGIMAKPKKGKKAQTSGKIILPVETDVKKLVSFVCGSNILKEGQDVEIKPDSEYPEWLWNIRTGPPPKLEELDPNTKAYWRKLRKDQLRRNNLIAKNREY